MTGSVCIWDEVEPLLQLSMGLPVHSSLGSPRPQSNHMVDWKDHSWATSLFHASSQNIASLTVTGGCVFPEPARAQPGSAGQTTSLPGQNEEAGLGR